jgi:hypothetical protein
MSETTVAASREQIENVLKVLQRSMPNGAMFEQIEDQTGYSNDVIWSAIHLLEREGKIVGRNPFAYDPDAVDVTNESDSDSLSNFRIRTHCDLRVEDCLQRLPDKEQSRNLTSPRQGKEIPHWRRHRRSELLEDVIFLGADRDISESP